MNDFQKYIKLLHEIAIVNIENGTPNNVKNEVRALQIRYNIRGNLQKIALEILREETQKLQLEFVKEMYSPIGNMASKSLLKIEKNYAGQNC